MTFNQMLYKFPLRWSKISTLCWYIVDMLLFLKAKPRQTNNKGLCMFGFLCLGERGNLVFISVNTRGSSECYV